MLAFLGTPDINCTVFFMSWQTAYFENIIYNTSLITNKLTTVTALKLLFCYNKIKNRQCLRNSSYALSSVNC